MQITLIPIRRDHRPRVERRGEALIVDGETYDFSALPDGALLPAEAIDSAWIAGPVTRDGGVLRLGLRLSHGPDAPPETLFPAPLCAGQDGPLPLPPHGSARDGEGQA